MAETIHVLGITVYSYGLAVAAAALVLFVFMGVLMHRLRLPAGSAQIFGLLSIVLGILFARLFFCLFNLSFFLETYENPWLMLRFWDGGLSMAGALTGLVLAAWFTARLMSIRFALFMDILSMPLALFIAICRVGEMATDLGVGKIVGEGFFTAKLPGLFKVETVGIATEYRMAVFMYEFLAAVILMRLLLILSRKVQRQPGDTALIFFALYGSSQVLFESMRDDGHMLIVFLRVSQLFAALLPVIVTFILTKRYLRIRGNADRQVAAAWGVLLATIVVCVLLEFSLDGRVTIGQPSMLRDYLIMTVMCVLLFAVPYSLFLAIRKKTGLEASVMVGSMEETPTSC